MDLTPRKSRDLHGLFREVWMKICREPDLRGISFADKIGRNAYGYMAYRPYIVRLTTPADQIWVYGLTAPSQHERVIKTGRLQWQAAEAFHPIGRRRWRA